MLTWLRKRYSGGGFGTVESNMDCLRKVESQNFENLNDEMKRVE